MLTIDTSGLIALTDRDQPSHTACVAVVDGDPGPYYVPTAILAEIGYLLETRYHPDVERAVLADIRRGAYRLDWNTSDMERIERLVVAYHDMRLGLADAAVIACAERRGGRVLTLDYRHFSVVARGMPTIQVLPVPNGRW